jgi:serine/threonine protein kinase
VVDQLTQHDPRRIGPFEVLGRLGAGGMGLVYLARSASGRRVAIKTVRTELAEDQLFRVRFTREVEAARAVSGFYTAAVVDADPRAAVPWLATAYVPAPSLEEIVNECGPMPAQAVRWLAAGVAEALQSIHGAGLVHRDLKPSNVLVVEDGPRVIDFGIASGVSNTRLTMTNVAVGTPAYMSPSRRRTPAASPARVTSSRSARCSCSPPPDTPRSTAPTRSRPSSCCCARAPTSRASRTNCARSSSPACRWRPPAGPTRPTSRPSSPRTSSAPAPTTAVRPRPGCPSAR